MAQKNAVREKIGDIINSSLNDIDKAIELTLFVMKTQIFMDGNKRTAIIFANHYLISKAGGLLVIPENHVSEFKKLLIGYYENKDNGEIKAFLKQNCHRNFR